MPASAPRSRAVTKNPKSKPRHASAAMVNLRKQREDVQQALKSLTKEMKKAPRYTRSHLLHLLTVFESCCAAHSAYLFVPLRGSIWARVRLSCRGLLLDLPLESCEETRKHKRLMKRSAQLDWDDLREIAKMKGMAALEILVGGPVLPRESAAADHGDDATAAAAVVVGNPAEPEAEPGSDAGRDEGDDHDN